MEFGSQQVFDYIKHNLSYAKNELWYDRLYAVVKGDVLGILSVYKLQETDKDDIVQQRPQYYTMTFDELYKNSFSGAVWNKIYSKSIIDDNRLRFDANKK